MTSAPISKLGLKGGFETTFRESRFVDLVLIFTIHHKKRIGESMNKQIYSIKQVALYVVITMVFFFIGCKVSDNIIEKPDEIWHCNFTGMASWEAEIYIIRNKNNSGADKVTGKFVNSTSKIARTAGGYGGGTVRGSIKGSLENSILKTRITGKVTIDEGTYPISGTMKGIFEGKSASGTWIVRHQDGAHSGKWTAWITD